MAMLLSRRLSPYSKILPRTSRAISYAEQGYFGQPLHPSHPDYQSDVQKRLEVRLQGRLENQKYVQKFGKVDIEPEFPVSFPPTDLSKMDPRPITKLIPVKKVRVGVIAKKLGMMGLWDEHGIRHAVTVLQVDNVEVFRWKVRTNNRRGLSALVLGYGSQKIHRTTRDLLGEYHKYKVCPKRRLVEFPVSRNALLPPGTQIDVRHFVPGQKVDICGNTQFKRWCGVVKKWGFAGGPASHGSTKFHRRPGSIGACADPGKVWKGKKMAGNMGGHLHWHKHQRIMRIDPRHGLIFLKGCVPGHRKAYVKIVDALYRAPNKAPFPTFFPDPNETDPGPPVYWNETLRTTRLTVSSPDEKDWVDRFTPYGLPL